MKKRGFTLIEMLIVIVIIGILAAALIPRIGSARDKANDTAIEANVRSLATAMVSYGIEHGSYPDATGDNKLPSGTLTGYSIPSNNFDGSPAGASYHYQKMDSGKHFIFWAVLSAGTGNVGGGNCTHTGANATSLNYATASAWNTTSGDSFCYFQ